VKLAAPNRFNSPAALVHCILEDLRMTYLLRLLAGSLLLCSQTAWAGMPVNRVPAPLAPWVDWVLHDTAEVRCPLVYNQTGQRRCAWPSVLILQVGEQAGEFTQRWTVDAESWLTLPGDLRAWPQEVRLDGYPTIVLERDGRPVLKAGTGEHTVSGRFYWPRLPDSLAVPPDTALLSLQVAGQAVPNPRFEEQGRLGFQAQAPRADPRDHLAVQVFRRLQDDIPLQLTTRLSLTVAGQAREELLGRALPDGFVPLSLTSPLPARLEADGRLRVQLKPGTWLIEFNARHEGTLDQVSPPAPQGPWAAEEIWTFQAMPALRVVTVQGAPNLDPAQTNLPDEWRNLPAYLLTPAQSLQLLTRKRGDADPVPDRLSLERTLWLDFDGGGYTAHDRLTGTISRSARLEAAPPLQLGRVLINDQAQFITQLPGSALDGIEVREGRITLLADSRLEPEPIRSLPAVGWQIEPAELRMALNLPPGWRLLAAQGVDNASRTWLNQWSLLDLFILLITGVGFARLWGWPYGLLALCGLALAYHEPQAPRLMWLNVLAAIALLRVLPVGRLRTVISGYWRLSLFGLLAVVLVFSVQQVRGGLYPQLAHSPLAAVSLDLGGLEYQGESRPMSVAPPATPAPPAPAAEGGLAEADRVQSTYDPNTHLQTGPGLPDWSWVRAQLQWNGPVAADQRLLLWLSPPWATRVWLLLSAVLLGALVWRTSQPARRPRRPPPPAATLLLPALAVFSPFAQADDIPSPALLDELRARLIEAPDCQPRCAHLASLALRMTADDLHLRLILNGQADTAIPLPLPPGDQLLVQAVALDGQTLLPLYRAPDRTLWARLPAGQHEIELRALVPADRVSFQLPLAMAPGRVSTAVTGWEVEGIHDAGVDAQIQLTRLRRDAGRAPLQPGVMPAFVSVERELVLGIEWSVNTTVRRISQADSAVVLPIPLLPGERVTTPGLHVLKGQVLLNLPPDQAGISWSATLAKSRHINLQAGPTRNHVEIWRLRAAPLWHVETGGIPVVHRYDDGGQWLPEWRPWPGEAVRLTITRPAGVAGKTVTIDQVRLAVSPGQHATAALLAASIRSSRGAEQAFTLPAGADLTGVTINGVSQPLKLQDRRLVLPLAPGAQRVEIGWRTTDGIRSYYRTPAVELGADSVNTHLVVALSPDRWTLFAGGPPLGPAVLFWGVLLVVAVGAGLLGRYGQTPLSAWQWFLLGVGLSQAGLVGLLAVVAWLLLLGRRKQWAATLGTGSFNALQAAVVLLTLIALAMLLQAINQGLLGPPAMQITGNGSSAPQLQWYQDRSPARLPQAWVFSVPLYLYRGLMLAWALWLAFALLRWLTWGWGCFSQGGLWRRRGAPPQPAGV
jgi:hypothetical protein